MRLYKSFLFLLISAFCQVTFVQAQSNIVSAGGDGSGSGGSISISVGQINYLYTKNSSGSVSEGVQQVYEITVVQDSTGKDYQISATVYPNPTSEMVYLRIDKGKIEDMRCEIIDEEGRLIRRISIYEKETPISLRGLINSVYYIKVFKSIFAMKTFKVIKTS